MLSEAVDDDEVDSQRPAHWLLVLVSSQHRAVDFTLGVCVSLLLSSVFFFASSSPHSLPFLCACPTSTEPLSMHAKVSTASAPRSFDFVDWHSVCNRSYWPAIVDATLLGSPRLDDSSMLQSSDGPGSGRVLLVLMKRLCNETISFGIMGTSVSAKDADNELHYGRLVHRWLSMLRPLNFEPRVRGSSTSKVIYRNAAMAGTGTDFAALCLSSIFAVETWQPSPANMSSSSTDHVESVPREFWTAARATVYNRLRTMLPDLLLVEFAATDYAHVIQSGGWLLGNGSVAPSATVNMQRLLRHMWAHYTTAPVLLITSTRNARGMPDHSDDFMASIEPVYEAATHQHAIPLLSVRHSLGLPINHVSPTGLTVQQRVTAELATADVWHTHLFKDHAHLTLEGEAHVAVIITAYLNRFVTRLMSTIETGKQHQRHAARPNSAAIYPSSIVLGAAAVDTTYHDTGGGVCSIRWGWGTLNKGLISGRAVVESTGWRYDNQSTVKSTKEKFGWTSRQRGALIVFNLTRFGRDQQQSSQPVSCSVAYLRSYAADMGKARVWVGAVSAVDAEMSSHNVTGVQLLDGRWSLKQSTLVVERLSLNFSLGGVDGRGNTQMSGFQLYVLNEEDNRFVVAGINVDFG